MAVSGLVFITGGEFIIGYSVSIDNKSFLLWTSVELGSA